MPRTTYEDRISKHLERFNFVDKEIIRLEKERIQLEIKIKELITLIAVKRERNIAKAKSDISTALRSRLLGGEMEDVADLIESEEFLGLMDGPAEDREVSGKTNNHNEAGV